MKPKTFLCLALAAGLLAGAITTPAVAKDKLEARAKISKSTAMKTALAKVPGGKVKEGELEEENGKLIWSFDIATKGSKDISEIAVDAITGAIVAVATETPADQAKEKETDTAEKKAKQSEAAEADEKIAMGEVPPAVQQAVKTYATESEIKAIEKGDVDGTKVIEFDLEKNGKKSEIAFRKNGKLFSCEEEVALADVPEAVRRTINEEGAGGTIGTPEKVVREGKTSYEVLIEKAGKKTEFKISSAGNVTGREAVKKCLNQIGQPPKHGRLLGSGRYRSGI
jgi:uncharacterized membrane protein YkoI